MNKTFSFFLKKKVKLNNYLKYSTTINQVKRKKKKCFWLVPYVLVHMDTS